MLAELAAEITERVRKSSEAAQAAAFAAETARADATRAMERVNADAQVAASGFAKMKRGACDALGEAIGESVVGAREAGVEAAWCDALQAAVGTVGEVTAHLGGLGMAGDAEGMLLHSADYLSLLSIVVVAWQWLDMAAAAKRGLVRGEETERAFYEGKIYAAQYWIATELPKTTVLAELCRTGEDSYARIDASSF